jgi:hypothetical protein
MAALVLLTGCAGHGVRNAVEPTPLHKAQTEIPEDQLLDVGIQVFDPGPSLQGEDADDEIPISEDTRKAEARFIPYHLKNTLQKTGHWGAVRVIPADTEAVDVHVQGQILTSDGAALELKIQVRDSTGRLWLDKRYAANADEEAYQDTLRGEQDAYQDLYNAIANDMLVYRQGLTGPQQREIRTVSMLRYAADLGPEVLDGYLGRDPAGRYTVKRLPADDDPMLQRMLNIREREYLLIDTVNEHYENFYLSMWGPYENWRRFYREESKALDEVKQKEFNRKLLGAVAIIGAIALEVMGQSGSIALATGGILAYKSGMDIGEQAEIHEESIQELNSSFNAEISPMVVDVEGNIVKLTGSAEAQFKAWQRLLREIYAQETGFEPEPEPGPEQAPDTEKGPQAEETRKPDTEHVYDGWILQP